MNEPTVGFAGEVYRRNLQEKKAMSNSAINGTNIFSDIEWAEIVEELSLSPREGEIIKGLFADKAHKKIAIDLKMSIPTVRTHMSRLFQKLQANDRGDLILHVFGRFRQNCRKLGCPRFRRHQK